MAAPNADSSGPRRTIVLRSLATLAALGFIALALALLRPSDAESSLTSPRDGRRLLLGLGLRGFHFHPETVEPRQQQQVLNHVTGHLGLAGPHVAPARLVPADPNDLRSFPWRTAPGPECVSASKVLNLSEMIRDLYHTHGVRIVPRNGFLLGIMRHGGFLPVEKPDDDLGVVYTDLLGLIDPEKGVNPDEWIALGEYRLQFKPTEDFWVNWQGTVPGRPDDRYPYFRVFIKRVDERGAPRGKMIHALAIYPYYDTGRYFYPRIDIDGVNHEQHVVDGIRWNKEGADLRLVDTDELMTEDNYADGKQLGNYFDTDFSCTQEVQFYFTTVYVPCDYEKIITSFYGSNWRNVERRGPKGSDIKKNTNYSTERISDEENEMYMRMGPRPLCKASMKEVAVRV